MKMYVSEKKGDPILIIQPKTTGEVQILNNLERVQGPLTAKVLHAPGYGTPHLEIRRSKS